MVAAKSPALGPAKELVTTFLNTYHGSWGHLGNSHGQQGELRHPEGEGVEFATIE